VGGGLGVFHSMPSMNGGMKRDEERCLRSFCVMLRAVRDGDDISPLNGSTRMM